MTATTASDSDKPALTTLQPLPPVSSDKSGRQSPRPSFSSNRPYWIGPARAATLGIATMPQKAQIHYSHAGLQPPVYVAGSLGESHWEPIEMEHKEKEDGELDFWHEFNAEPGQYQYKFRLGPGDWWVLDENQPTVDDGTGNRNNLLVVEPESFMSKQKDASLPAAPVQVLEKTPAVEAPIAASDQVLEKTSKVDAPTASPVQALEKPQKEDTPAAASIQASEKTQHIPEPGNDQQDIETTSDVDDDVLESERNLLKHETVQPIDDPDQTEAPASEQEMAQPAENESGQQHDPDHDQDESPLFEHEAGPIKRIDSKRQFPFLDCHVDSQDEAVEDDEFDTQGACPLFRHESMSAVDADPDEAPLFRHESMSPTGSSSIASPTSPMRHRPDIQDIYDPSLEPFPTDQAGILAHLYRTETRLPEDETVFEGTPLSPSLAQPKSFVSDPAPVSLRSDASDLSPHLDCIDETEEIEDDHANPPVEKKDSVVEPVPIAVKINDVSELSEDKPLIASINDLSSRRPPTPPMTPDEHHETKTSVHDGSADPNDAPRFRAKLSEGTRSRKNNVTDNITGRPNSGDKSLDDGKSRSFWVWFANLCGGQGRATGVAITLGVAAAAFAINASTP